MVNTLGIIKAANVFNFSCDTDTLNESERLAAAMLIFTDLFRRGWQPEDLRSAVDNVIRTEEQRKGAMN